MKRRHNPDMEAILSWMQRLVLWRSLMKGESITAPVGQRMNAGQWNRAGQYIGAYDVADTLT